MLRDWLCLHLSSEDRSNQRLQAAALSPKAAPSSLFENFLHLFGFFSALCVPVSLTSVCTSRWTETARRERTSWGGRSTWWGRCWRCSSAWSPCPVAWWGESEPLMMPNLNCFLISHLLGNTPHGAAVLCRQAASTGHWETSTAVETSAVAAGDLPPPPAERPELLGGGEAKPTKQLISFSLYCKFDTL